MSLEENTSFYCPYCGQTNTQSVDITQGAQQQFVVDCEICCAPIVLRISMFDDEISVDARRENE